MEKPLKTPPVYAIASVDHALRIASMLQLEGALTVADAAERLGVARSTAHRLLQMLVYRDFAAQGEDRSYHSGPVLQLAAHSGSETSRLRTAALPHLQRLVDAIGESANLTVRAGTTARFVASVECSQALRVGNREGMVFPAHRTTAGLLLLAELSADELTEAYAAATYAYEPEARPDLRRLRAELTRIRRAGFAVNNGRSERGVVAVGVPVRGAGQRVVAGVSLSMPSVRYDRNHLPGVVAALQKAAAGIEQDLTPLDG
ncbi:IclR family transcriptional regulator [Acrocarpospora catenulata]|uniref:IclR family transcriptional regulator n=1 Tax=Acrocarpospora catenulata TaxID=2836182 RepID=UPI001BD967E3|nr:IclR family transcriptional regulator [Acrocarpospora catenulata]